jgi:hypothetical protein
LEENKNTTNIHQRADTTTDMPTTPIKVQGGESGEIKTAKRLP